MESSSPVFRSGNVGFALTSEDRLRIYRKCFHDLDKQLVQLQEEGSAPSEAEVQFLQAEMRCLEELIMQFTDISSAVSSKLTTGAGFDPSLPNVDGLNMSLVTDILMLSATSPWTVFVAERSQWQISYVSPSVKRMFGWKPSELLGVPAWDGCHTEDVAALQRMLLLKEGSTSGTSLLYRRLRKDRTYVTVQAIGRAVGVGWYAWVEQETNLSNRPHESPSELPVSLFSSKSNGKAKQTDSESGTKRGRKLSTTQRQIVEPDITSKPWNSGVPRPSSPLATAPVLERPSRLQKSRPETVAETEAPFTEMQEAESSLKGMTLSNVVGYTGSEHDKLKKGKSPQAEVVPVPSKLKSAAGASPPSPTQSANNEEFALLWGKKVLLVEDDRINRTIAQKLLENLKCRVTVACNGKEALDILQEEPSVNPDERVEGEIPPQFDLVLMDLLMPVMDGTKAVEFFRDWEAEQEPPRKRMVIFALTSNVSDGDMVKCAISGFDEFVSKPLTIDKLLDRLASKRW